MHIRPDKLGEILFVTVPKCLRWLARIWWKIRHR